MWYIFLHYYCLLLGKNCHHSQRLTPPAHMSVEGICFKQFSKIERILKFGKKYYFICNSRNFWYHHIYSEKEMNGQNCGNRCVPSHRWCTFFLAKFGPSEIF